MQDAWQGSSWAAVRDGWGTAPHTFGPPTSSRVVLVGTLGLFVPGVTTPFYEPRADFLGQKNVGNLPNVARTLYPGTVTNGVTSLSTAGAVYNNYDFVDTILDVKANCTFNNCRVVMTGNDYVLSDSIRGLVRSVNGSQTLVTFNDCEVHCRGQRVLNPFVGRNLVLNRCVISGGVDGPDDSPAGSAPQSFGIVRNDCWIGYQAWWKTQALPWEGHGSDTQTHNDGSQVATTLGNEWHNCTLVTCASPWVGTGTPGAGSDDGNSYVPATGTNYIYTKAVQESLRAAALDYLSTPSQSLGGVSRQMGSSGGSWACIMGNRNGGVVDHCTFSGGTVCVNLMDTNVTGAWSVKRSTFYNDMVNGHAGNPATKGHAVLARAGLNGVLDMPTTGADRNLWFDGTTVTPTFA